MTMLLVGCLCGGLLEAAAGVALFGAVAKLVHRHRKKGAGKTPESTCECEEACSGGSHPPELPPSPEGTPGTWTIKYKDGTQKVIPMDPSLWEEEDNNE